MHMGGFHIAIPQTLSFQVTNPFLCHPMVNHTIEVSAQGCLHQSGQPQGTAEGPTVVADRRFFWSIETANPWTKSHVIDNWKCLILGRWDGIVVTSWKCKVHLNYKPARNSSCRCWHSFGVHFCLFGQTSRQHAINRWTLALWSQAEFEEARSTVPNRFDRPGVVRGMGKLGRNHR